MENGLFPRDVVCVIARTLVEETFVLEALMMCWTCKHWRLSLTRDRTLWKSALRLLSGSVQNFNLPERDYLLDGVEDEQYPLPVSIPALACANCVKLENELLVDLFPLCVTFLKSESRLIREAVNQMTLNDSSCFWSLRAVAEWQIQHSIALPRPFRRLFQFCAGGATFCDGLFRLWSLEEIAAKRETPKTTLYSVLQTSPLQNDKHLAALIRESPVHGVRSSSIESMLGKPNLHEFVAFASAHSVGMYDQSVTLYFNTKPHLGEKPVIPSKPYSMSVWFQYQHEMAAFWLHDDPSGNGEF